MSLKKVSEVIVSCGIPLHMPLGTLLGSLLVFPLLLGLFALHVVFTTIVWWLIALIGVVAIAALQLVLIEPLVPCLFVVDKILGLLLGFACQSLTFKLTLFGFFFFHFIRVFVEPLLLRKLTTRDQYRWPRIVFVLVPSLVAGLTTNIVLRIVAWVGS